MKQRMRRRLGIRRIEQMYARAPHQDHQERTRDQASEMRKPGGSIVELENDEQQLRGDEDDADNVGGQQQRDAEKQQDPDFGLGVEQQIGADAGRYGARG